VVGVDLSAVMLREAERQARAEGLTNVRFEQADAQIHGFSTAAFDVAISRFGVMFFEDAVAAFANVASAIRPGGRCVFLCWQDLLRNDWIMIPAGAALAYVPFPDLGAEGAPGPFSLADPDRIRTVLTQAGFGTVEVTDVADAVYLGQDAADATEFLRGTGMARVLLEDADADTQQKAMEAVRDTLEGHEQPGGIWLGAAAWLIEAARR
jgi:SAM-dependent methyltransferase